MNDSISINTALCLPSSDLVALSKGRMITALSRTYINSVQQFALCPVEEKTSSSTTFISHWAKLEFCNIYTDPVDIEKLARLTIWSNNDLQKILQERYKLFLLCLRVFQIPQAIELSIGNINASKLGSFIKLPRSLFANHEFPVLDDELFFRRKQQLIHLEKPEHPELEELHEIVTGVTDSDKSSQVFINFIQTFLGWTNKKFTSDLDPELRWIYDIDALGTRSKELDEGKSNYQAGTDFENVVRRGLEFLGFSVDETYKGGAGGLDLFCSKPYSLVGECKAGKKIPSGTTEELIKLGGMRLGREQFLVSAKLIIGPGSPTQDVLTAANEWRVSIINPMSLQKLVELQAKYPGSVNLIDLKQYLEPGQIDSRIDEYIARVLEDLKLRAHIIQVIKKYLDQVKDSDSNIDTLFGVYSGSNPPKFVNHSGFREILVELSSPLTGYLGRVKDSDRFYFLRNMPEVDLSES